MSRLTEFLAFSVWPPSFRPQILPRVRRRFEHFSLLFDAFCFRLFPQVFFLSALFWAETNCIFPLLIRLSLYLFLSLQTVFVLSYSVFSKSPVSLSLSLSLSFFFSFSFCIHFFLSLFAFHSFHPMTGSIALMRAYVCVRVCECAQLFAPAMRRFSALFYFFFSSCFS